MDSTDGSCATSWSCHDAGEGEVPSSLFVGVAIGGRRHGLRASKLGAGRRIRTHVPAVEGGGGKSPEGNASAHGRAASGARRFRDAGGSSPGPLSARLLSVQVRGGCG